MNQEEILIRIPEDIREKFLQMKPKQPKNKRTFYDWEDALLLYMWNTYRKEDIAKLLRCSIKSIRMRYKQLKRNKNEST